MEIFRNQLHSVYQQFIGNKGIKNVLTKSRFEDILQNVHILDNTKYDKSGKG